MDIVLLIIVIVCWVVSLISSVYMFAWYSHHDEQRFAKSWITRIFTILIIMFSMLQQFLIPLDLSNAYNNAGLDLDFLFSFYYWALALWLFIFLPFSTFYYETSEDTSTKARIRGALFRSVSYALVVIIVIVVSFFVTDSSDSKEFTVYVIAFHMILGWFVLFFALGVGFVALPFDLIYGFMKRPKPMKSAEFEVQKKTLLNSILFLRLRCHEALEERVRVENQRGIKKWWNSSRLTRKVSSLHWKSIILEEEYVKLIKISKYNKYIEPMVDYFKLMLGIFLIIVNILFVVQLIGCQFIEPSKVDSWKFKFLNSLIDAFSKESVGLGFLTTAFFFLLSCHLTYSAFYGNTKLGLRYGIYTYAPLTPKETLYNNICYNVFLINLWSAAIVQLLIQAFKNTLKSQNSTWFDIFYNKIDKLSFHKTMYDDSIFIYITLSVSALFFLYQFLYPDDLQFVLKSVDKKKKSYGNIKRSETVDEQLLNN